MFRANTRNAVVLEKYLREKGAKALKAQGQGILTADPSDPDEFDRYEDEGGSGSPPPYSGRSQAEQRTQTQGNGLPSQDGPPAQAERGGWFSGFGSKKRQSDVERGTDLRVREN